MRKSLELTNWERASDLVRNWEADSNPNFEAHTVEGAADLFLADCESRYLSKATISKYKLLFGELKGRYGKWSLKNLAAAELDDYRKTWKLAPISSRKKLERIRTFFRFCIERDMLRKNPATFLKPPKVIPAEKETFTPHELERILWACEVYPNKGVHGPNTSKRVKAFVLLLRWSGIRISDAVLFGIGSLEGSKVKIRTKKANTYVYIPLPEEAYAALMEIHEPGTKYFFWSGNGQLKSAVVDWQRTLKKLFALAGVKGSAHEFRHTFATELLEKGASLESVSLLLGHRSITVTELHYAHLTLERRTKLEDEVEKLWS